MKHHNFSANNACAWLLFACMLFPSYVQALAQCTIRLTISKIANKTNLIIFPPKNLDLPIAEDDQSPGGSYENLRKIIHAVIQEVIRLPEFYNQKNVGAVAAVEKDKQPYPPFEPKNYEDLLATAVINKVIEEFGWCLAVTGSLCYHNFVFMPETNTPVSLPGRNEFASYINFYLQGTNDSTLHQFNREIITTYWIQKSWFTLRLYFQLKN